MIKKGYVEISNIIVRNSIITDNNDTYTRKQFRVGGIIGNLEDNHETRLFNLSSDVKIKMLSNARLNADCYMAEGIGCYGNPNTGNSYVIPLTNIYVHNKLETSNTSNKLKIGGVIGNKDMGAGNSATENWYYASPVSGTQNNMMNNGTQKSLADFAMTFVNQNNTYISDKNIEDKTTWTYTEGTGFAFGSTTVTVERGINAVITAETKKAMVQTKSISGTPLLTKRPGSCRTRMQPPISSPFQERNTTSMYMPYWKTEVHAPASSR